MNANALIVSSAARLKPEARLAQAISEYESDLSAQQKSEFSIQNNINRDLPPEVQDVMQFTAKVDGDMARQKSNCVGTRMTKFLTAVQEFAALGDVIVGGSQNLVACGVWSVVRMSLLAIIKHSPYLEEVSSLLMHVGLSAPRYQSIATLYPQAPKLRSLLYEYFIVVVRLCHHVLKFSQKSFFGQFTSSLVDSGLNTYKKDLEVWANSIKEEVTLLLSKGTVEESKENSLFRLHTRKYHETKALQHKLKIKKRVLDFCSVYDYETIWKQTRKVGQATLFQGTSEYESWKGRDYSCTLIYTGKLGAGKSVLLANIVDDLNLSLGKSGDRATTVAYFFCRNDTPESLQAQTVVCSLARQLLHQTPNVQFEMDDMDASDAFCSSERALKILKRFIPSSAKAYFVLDGLDECARLESEELIEVLKILQRQFSLRICVSFRLEPDLSLRNLFSDPIILAFPDQNPDIEAFIEKDLEACLNTGKLSIGNPTLVLEIQDALMSGSQGMFLWVVLQIETLCHMRTDEEIRDALKDLPKTLSETFTRILEKSEQRSSYQRKLLELLSVARRPLTAYELQEALSVVPGDAVWDPARILNDINSVLPCCGCLITVDEEEQTVRLVHYSVKQFLLKTFLDSEKPKTVIGRAEQTMAEISITYLSYDIFEKQVSTVVMPQILAGSVPPTVINSTLGTSSKTTKELAIRLLRSRKARSLDVGQFLARQSSQFPRQQESRHHFLGYAKEYWLKHVLGTTSDMGKRTVTLLVEICRKTMADTPPSSSSEIELLLVWASMHGYNSIICLFPDAVPRRAEIIPSLPYPFIIYEASLLWAVRNSHIFSFEALYKMIFATDPYREEKATRAIHRAILISAIHKRESLFQRLSHLLGNITSSASLSVLSNELIDFTSATSSGLVSLGYERVYLDLYETWTENLYEDWETTMYEPALSLFFDWKTCTPTRYSPLYLAAKKGDEVLVERIIDLGQLPLDKLDPNGDAALHIATKNEHKGVVRILLRSGKVNNVRYDRDIAVETTLQAVRAGQMETAQLFLSRWANRNLQKKDQTTMLSMAVGLGNEEIVQAVVGAGTADVNAGNPLLLATEQGCMEICRILLQSGADPWTMNRDGTPLLFVAAEKSHFEIFSILLQFILAKDSSSQRRETLLKLAADRGHAVALKALLFSDGVGNLSMANSAVAVAASTLALEVEKMSQIIGGRTKAGFLTSTLDGHLLQVAVRAGDNDSAELILKIYEQLDIDYQGADGYTSLMCAAERANAPLVRLLMEHGANPDVKTVDGRTASTIARDAGAPEMSSQTCNQYSIFNITSY